MSGGEKNINAYYTLFESTWSNLITKSQLVSDFLAVHRKRLVKSGNLNGKFPLGPDAMMHDVWSVMYTEDYHYTRVADARQILQRVIVDKMNFSPHMQRIRWATEGDAVMSLMVAVDFTNEFMREINRNAKLCNQVCDLVAQMNRDNVSVFARSEEESNDDEKRKAEEKELEAMFAVMGHDLSKVVETAAENAETQLAQIKTNLGSAGINPRKLADQNPEKLLRMMDELRTSGLHKLHQLIGRANDVSDNVVQGDWVSRPGEIVDFTLSGDLARTVPSEMVGLLHKLRRYDLFRRMNDHALLSYEQRLTVPVGAGRIIICLDTSGSMYNNSITAKLHHSRLSPTELFADTTITKFHWAKALALLVVKMSLNQRRTVRVIPFNSEIVVPKPHGAKAEVWKQWEARNQQGEALCSSLLAQRWGGGTNFCSPLSLAMEMIADEEHYKQADILLITDGEDYGGMRHYISQFKELKRKHRVRVWGWMIEDPATEDSNLRARDSNERIRENMLHFCDTVWISKPGEKIAGDILKSLYFANK